MKINFTVYGKPFGKQRPRFSRRGRYTTTYTPQKTVDYEQQVKEACYEKMLLMDFEGWQDDKPLYTIVNAYYEIPKSYSKAKRLKIINGDIMATQKPDVDNILKIVLDPLNNFLFPDDKQIVRATIYKHYSDSPRVEIEIGEIEKEG